VPCAARSGRYHSGRFSPPGAWRLQHKGPAKGSSCRARSCRRPSRRGQAAHPLSSQPCPSRRAQATHAGAHELRCRDALVRTVHRAARCSADRQQQPGWDESSRRWGYRCTCPSRGAATRVQDPDQARTAVDALPARASHSRVVTGWAGCERPSRGRSGR
jgi:hypothetical protein